MSKVENFFKEYSVKSNKSYLFSGENNLSVDGSGVLPSINNQNAILIKPLIEKYITKETIWHLDLGCGVSWLSKILDGFENIESYGLEGSNNLIPHFVHDKSKTMIFDLSREFSDERLYKSFDITTSFELIEHVHRTHQLQFWKNVTYLSNHHLCSIHVENEEHDEHCTINTPKVWEEIFEELGIKYEVIFNFPIKEFDCSVFYFLTMPNKITKTSNFR